MIPMADSSDIFLVKARRCLRCGGLLTSRDAVAEGYGHVCKMKVQQERIISAPVPGQMTLFPLTQDEIDESEDKHG